MSLYQEQFIKITLFVQGNIKDKKYGFFSNQAKFFDDVASELGLKISESDYMRHPLAFLGEERINCI